MIFFVFRFLRLRFRVTWPVICRTLVTTTGGTTFTWYRWRPRSSFCTLVWCRWRFGHCSSGSIGQTIWTSLRTLRVCSRWSACTGTRWPSTFPCPFCGPFRWLPQVTNLRLLSKLFYLSDFRIPVPSHDNRIPTRLGSGLRSTTGHQEVEILLPNSGCRCRHASSAGPGSDADVFPPFGNGGRRGGLQSGRNSRAGQNDSRRSFGAQKCHQLEVFNWAHSGTCHLSVKYCNVV